MIYDIRCKFCGRESMDYSPLDNSGDTVQCMACGLESSLVDAKTQYADWHWKHDNTVKSTDALSPDNLKAWKLKR